MSTLKTDLTKHILFTEHAHIKQICAPLMKLDITDFIYMRSYPDGKTINLSTNLDWSEFFLTKYLNAEYQIEDIQNHMLLSDGVTLWCAEKDNKVWKEGAEQFKCGNGITICFPQLTYKETVSFYTSINNCSINQFYLEHFDVLKRFCAYFQEKARPIIERALRENNMLITPTNYLITPTNTIEYHSNQRITNFLADINGEHDKKLVKEKERDLTKRELECIKACMQGNTSKQVARILNISPRTVEVHLSHAKEKLNCANVKELIFVTAHYFKGTLIS